LEAKLVEKEANSANVLAEVAENKQLAECRAAFFSTNNEIIINLN
jgi:hypothetical protein